jgi:hypothetical protein
MRVALLALEFWMCGAAYMTTGYSGCCGLWSPVRDPTDYHKPHTGSMLPSPVTTKLPVSGKCGELVRQQ